MAFSYDDALTESLDKVRFAIGDTERDKGPRPDGRNFSDAEIAYLLTTESSVVNAAIALAFETLRDEWASFTVAEKEGDVSFDAKAVSDQFDKSAKHWRAKSDTIIAKPAKFRVHNVAC